MNPPKTTISASSTNVDFYSGIIYKALVIPVNMFTVMFAVARTVGWISHWIEMMSDPDGFKIGRPRQLYVGEGWRDVLPLAERDGVVEGKGK